MRLVPKRRKIRPTPILPSVTTRATTRGKASCQEKPALLAPACTAPSYGDAPHAVRRSLSFSSLAAIFGGMIASPIRNALVSVSDKTGLLPLAQGLADAGVTIYSTGGTRRHLSEAGIDVVDVADYTGFPEMMDGRVKTLHPKVHGGLLCRRDLPEHRAALEQHDIVPFDLVVVNLYPFEQTIAKQGVADAEAIEQIDIGGPSMIRSAAKNHQFVTVATNPTQYEVVLKEIAAHGATTGATRRQLAQAAFAQTARYDAAIASYFARTASSGPDDNAAAEASFPAETTLTLKRKSTLRYGENPHQLAALFAADEPTPGSLVAARQLHGKELSYNNLLDLDAAQAVAASLPRPGVAVLKHNNPCGAATGASLAEAAEKAWAGDPVSAFGSVLGVNVPVDGPMAELLSEPGKFVEAIIAPSFTPEAVEILTTRPKWKANVRLLETGDRTHGPGQLTYRQIDGGWLCQSADDGQDQPAEWQTVTEASPTADQQADLAFAWAACRHVKSNAIVLARQESLVGVGAGQMSRVDAVEIALKKAGERTRGAVLASDAFFPFDDSIEAAAKAGVGAVIQPGGSRRDEEVIAACNRHGLPMIFTGRRHFRH